MNKAFEKIIDELKQESIIVADDAGHRAVEIIEQIAEEYNNGWIPCSERLPETNKGVLVCTNEGQVDVDYYGEYTKDFIGLKGTEQYAIAWQPLPAPYKEGE